MSWPTAFVSSPHSSSSPFPPPPVTDAARTPSPPAQYRRHSGDDEDGLWPGSLSSSLLLPYSDYSERREDEDVEGRLLDDGLTVRLGQEAGGRSERQEEAEAAEQDRLREAGSQGLFGQEEEQADDGLQTGPEEEEEAAVAAAAALQATEDTSAAAAVSTPPLKQRKRKRAEDAAGEVEADAAVSPAAEPPPAPVSRTASGDAAALVSSIAASTTAVSRSQQQQRSASSRLPEFAVPEPPASSGPKRRPMYHNRKPEEFSLSFSLPPSYSSLQQPAASLANVSPISHDYSSNAAAGFSPASSRSTLPPPLSHSATAAAYATQAAYAVPFSSSSRPFAAASPPHPPPLHHSPSVPPLSPHASPRISWPPSSPRTDSITSVTHRVEQWQRAGRVQRMMKNVHQHSASSAASSAAAAAVSSSLSPLSTLPTRLPDSSNREALLRIDRYLRRRYVFTVLDSDQLVRGTVYNKTSAGLIITIRQVEGGGAAEAMKGEPPVLSSASGDGREEELRELDELEIRGECHLSEMQAALQGDGWRAAEPLDSRAVLDGYGVGDTVRALVISVDVHSEKVYLSMNNARLRHIAAAPQAGSAAAQQIRLGPYKETALSPHGKPALPPPSHAATDSLQPSSAMLLPSLPASSLASSSPLSSSSSPYSLLASPSASSLPVPYGFPSFHRSPGASLSSPSAAAGSSPAYASLSSSFSSFPVPRRRARPANYLRWLRAQPLFLNPAGLRILLAAYAINQYGSLCPPITIPSSSLYLPLRAEQNLQWARDTTLKGIGMAKRGAYANAHKLYAHALEIEPRYVQAFVARGAAFVLEGRWAEGEKQFELALEIDPAHVHARQYLRACRERLRKDRAGGAAAAAAAAGDTAAAAAVGGGKDASSVAVEEEKKEDEEMETEKAEAVSRPSPAAASGASADGGSSRRAVFVLSDDSSTDDESRGRGREEEEDDDDGQHESDRRRGDRKDRKRERRPKDKKRRRDRRRDRSSPSPSARSAKDKEDKHWLQLD